MTENTAHRGVTGDATVVDTLADRQRSAVADQDTDDSTVTARIFIVIGVGTAAVADRTVEGTVGKAGDHTDFPDDAANRIAFVIILGGDRGDVRRDVHVLDFNRIIRVCRD